nr:transporter substrate-binding domain-containing protein [uncultured Pseudomonas sp.]
MKPVLIVALLALTGWFKAWAGSNYLVGVEALNYYPHYSHQDGRFNGFAREVLDAFARSKGYSFEYRPLPVARLYESFFSGALDFKYPDNPDWQENRRQGKNIRYSDPVASYIDGVLVLPAHKGKGIERLATLGTVRGFTPWAYLALIEQGRLRVNAVTNFQQSLQQGILGRVDGVYINVDVGRHQLENVLKRPGALVFDEALPHAQGAYRLSSLKHTTLIEEFNAFLNLNAAEVRTLKDKYGLQ